jgi:hypothetical protein
MPSPLAVPANACGQHDILLTVSRVIHIEPLNDRSYVIVNTFYKSTPAATDERLLALKKSAWLICGTIIAA